MMDRQDDIELQDRLRVSPISSMIEHGISESCIDISKSFGDNHLDLRLDSHPHSITHGTGADDHDLLVPRKPIHDDDSANYPQEPETPARRIHWRMPASIMFFLLAGVVCAIGHHIYYSWLDDQIVNHTDASWDLTSQQWRLRIGTGFAFLVKVLLATSAVIAYKQCAWTEFDRRTHSVRAIDAIFASTGDLSSYLSPKFLFRVSPLPFIAAVAWLLPISALITPATLTVVSSHKSTSFNGSVPALDLNSSLIFGDSYTLGVPSRVLAKLANSVSVDARILQMDVIYPNSSYMLRFQGPSLQCRPAALDETGHPDMFIQQLARNLSYVTPRISTANEATNIYQNYQGYNVTPVFAALSGTMGYTKGSHGITVANDYFEDCVLDATTSGVCNFWTANVFLTKEPLPALFLLLRDQTWSCSIQVTNFSSTFQSTESEQSIDPEYSYTWVADWHTWRPNSNIVIGDFYAGFWITQALIDSLLGIIGVAVYKEFDSVYTNLIQFGEARIRYNAAYGLISHALNETNSHFVAGAGVPYDADHSTSMSRSPEEEALTRNLSLGSLIEEYSRNLTLSLFGQQQFWKPEDQRPDVTITTTIPVNRYHFVSQNLWIAYGISIFFASLCVLQGLIALHRNGVSHSMSFSSVVATTRNPTLDKIFAEESLGAEPISESALRHKLRFGQLRSDDEGKQVRMGFGLADEVVPLPKKRTSV